MRLSEEVQSKMTLLKVKDWETFQVVLRLMRKIGLRRKKDKTGGIKGITFALLVTVAVSWTSVSYASEESDAAVAVMDEVVVTATKAEEKRKDIVNSVVIKDLVDIEEGPAESIGSLLANEPGIDWRTRGNYGGAQEQIQIRGMDADGTQVLVNGVVANSASLGMADVGLIPMNSIEKIEVVKGPGSLLYGSGAAGGTVHIITKKPKHDEPVTRIEAGYGTEETYQVSAESGRFVNDSFGYYFTAARRETDGERDNGDLERNDLSLKFLLDKGEPLEVGLYFDFIDRQFGVPGVKPPEGTGAHVINGTSFYNEESSALQDRGEDENRRSTLEVKGKAADWINWRLQGSCSVQENMSHTRYSSSGAGDESTITNTVRSFEGNFDFAPVSMLGILVGTEYKDFNYENEQQTLDTNGNPDPAGFSEVEEGANTQGTFFEASVRPIEQVKLVAGYRYENHSEFGHADVGRIGAIINPSPSLAIKINHGEHFRAPTMNDLFWPDNGFGRGNGSLRPETGKHTDITYEQELLSGRVFVSASAFEWDINDKIDWAETTQPAIIPGWFYYEPTNLYKYHSQGLELSTTAHLPSSVDLDLALTLLDAEEEKSSGVTRQALYTPDMQFKLAFTHFADFGMTSNVVARYVSKRPGYYPSDSAADSQQDLDSYWTVDLKLAQKISEHWRAALTCINLLDEEYDTYLANFTNMSTFETTREGYPGAGRSLFASVSYEF